MEEIIEKRSQLLNYFFGQSKEYTKLDILNKEYSALSFSPREEYVDAFKTDYDNVLTPMEELEMDTSEVLVKGVIVDIDMKKNYCIIHLQNKGWNLSVSIDSNVLNVYGDYLQKGHLVIIKGHTYGEKIYMHFLIDYNTDDAFLREKNYLDGTSFDMIDELDYDNMYVPVALVKQAKYFQSKKGNNCLRIEAYENGQTKTYITCNHLPKNIVAGMFISYIPSDNDAFCNNVCETHI